MSDEPAEPSPKPAPDTTPQPEEIDAQELLDAANRAIAVARRQAARLFDAELLAGSKPEDRPEPGVPNP